MWSLKIYTDFMNFIGFVITPFLCRPKFLLNSSCFSRNKQPLLAFIPNFLAYTPSSICHCEVTMLINRSVLAAAKIRSRVVEARHRLDHLNSSWLPFPPSEPLTLDVATSAIYDNKISISLLFPCVVDIFTA